MIQIAAVIAVITAIEKFANVPLVERFLENWSHRSLNKIDDWIVDTICGLDPTEVEAALAKVQEKYDALTPVEKAEAKATIVAGPDQIDREIAATG